MKWTTFHQWHHSAPTTGLNMCMFDILGVDDESPKRLVLYIYIYFWSLVTVVNLVTGSCCENTQDPFCDFSDLDPWQYGHEGLFSDKMLRLFKLLFIQFCPTQFILLPFNLDLLLQFNDIVLLQLINSCQEDWVKHPVLFFPSLPTNCQAQPISKKQHNLGVCFQMAPIFSSAL